MVWFTTYPWYLKKRQITTLLQINNLFTSCRFFCISLRHCSALDTKQPCYIEGFGTGKQFQDSLLFEVLLNPQLSSSTFFSSGLEIQWWDELLHQSCEDFSKAFIHWGDNQQMWMDLVKIIGICFCLNESFSIHFQWALWECMVWIYAVVQGKISAYVCLHIYPACMPTVVRIIDERVSISNAVTSDIAPFFKFHNNKFASFNPVIF